MDITKFIGEPNNILDRMYEETKGEVLGFEQYLKLETTEGYKNNQTRIDRVKEETEKWGTIQEQVLIQNEIEEKRKHELMNYADNLCSIMSKEKVNWKLKEWESEHTQCDEFIFNDSVPVTVENIKDNNTLKSNFKNIINKIF